MRRALIAAIVLAVIVTALFLLPVKDWIRELLEWTTAHRQAASALFVVIYVISTVAFIPATPLTLAAGVIFGVVNGSLLVSAGSTLGASAAFFLGRGLARNWIKQKVSAWPRFRALDAALAQRGFLIVLLTRMSPAFPFFLLNYAYGVSAVRPRDYILASWLGMMPATIAYVYVGTLAANLAQALNGGAVEHLRGSPLRWILLGLGLLATVLVTIVVTRLAGKQLKIQLDDTSHD